MITCPVGSTPPRLESFRSRSSIGSISSAAASFITSAAAGLHRAEPAHRSARRVVRVHGRTLRSARCRRRRAPANAQAFAVTWNRRRRRRRRSGRASEGQGGASALLAVALQIFAGCRWTWPSSSSRPYTIFTGRLVCKASIADRDREILAASEGRPRRRRGDPHLLGLQPKAGRDLVAVDMEPLGGDVDVDAALRRHGDSDPRLRAERLVLAGRSRRPRSRLRRLRRRDPAADLERADDVRAWVVAVAVAHRRAIGMERLRSRSLARDRRAPGAARTRREPRPALRACSGSSAATTATGSP